VVENETPLRGQRGRMGSGGLRPPLLHPFSAGDWARDGRRLLSQGAVRARSVARGAI